MTQQTDLKPPTACPTCNGTDIDHYGEQYAHGRYFDYLGCGSCGARWTQIYRYADMVVTQTSRALL